MISIGIVPFVVLLLLPFIIPVALITYYGNRLCDVSQQLGYLEGLLKATHSQCETCKRIHTIARSKHNAHPSQLH